MWCDKSWLKRYLPYLATYYVVKREFNCIRSVRVPHPPALGEVSLCSWTMVFRRRGWRANRSQFSHRGGNENEWNSWRSIGEVKNHYCLIFGFEKLNGRCGHQKCVTRTISKGCWWDWWVNLAIDFSLHCLLPKKMRIEFHFWSNFSAIVTLAIGLSQTNTSGQTVELLHQIFCMKLHLR